MNSLKHTLLSEGGYYIHVALWITLALFSPYAPVVMALFVCESMYVLIKRPFLLALGFIVLLMIIIRIGMINDHVSRPVDMPMRGIITGVSDDKLTMKTDENQSFFVYGDQPFTVEPGWEVLIEGNVYKPDAKEIPHVFDYEKYLLAKNITASIYAESITVLNKHHDLRLWRHNVLSYIGKIYDGETEQFIKALVFGENEFSDEMNDVLRELNVAHLFALSGMHVGLIVLFLKGILRHLRLREDRVMKLTLIFLIVYAWLTGFRITMMRAILLYTGVFVLKQKHMAFSKLDVTVFTYLLFLLYNPFQLHMIGFQLSFLVVIVILLSKRLFEEKDMLTRIVGLSVLATAAALPILSASDDALNMGFILANMVFTPFLSCVLLPGTYIVLLAPMLSPVYEGLTDVFLYAVQSLKMMSFSVPVMLSKPWVKCMYWLVFLLMMMRIRTCATMFKRMGVLLVVIAMLSSMPRMIIGTRVIVFDVNQGDAIFIESDACAMLIDTGKDDDYDALLTFFSKEKISRLHALVLTHDHADHTGETSDLMGQMTVDQVFTNKKSTYPGTVLEEGDVLTCGDLRFLVVHGDMKSDNENNNSLVLYGRIGSENWLFASDIEAAAETLILNKGRLDVDVLKVAHHGSASSTSNAFLQAIDPSYAIVSLGKNNRYGMPDDDVMRRLSRVARVSRTDEDGSVMVYYLGWLDWNLKRTMREKSCLWKFKIP